MRNVEEKIKNFTDFFTFDRLRVFIYKSTLVNPIDKPFLVNTLRELLSFIKNDLIIIFNKYKINDISIFLNTEDGILNEGAYRSPGFNGFFWSHPSASNTIAFDLKIHNLKIITIRYDCIYWRLTVDPINLKYSRTLSISYDSHGNIKIFTNWYHPYIHDLDKFALEFRTVLTTLVTEVIEDFYKRIPIDIALMCQFKKENKDGDSKSKS